MNANVPNAVAASPYKEFSCREGTFEAEGREAIVFALLRKLHDTVPVSQKTIEIFGAVDTELRKTTIPPFPLLTDKEAEDEAKKVGVKKDPAYYRSWKAADQLMNDPVFMKAVETAWTKAKDEELGLANTLGANRDQAYGNLQSYEKGGVGKGSYRAL